MCGERLYLKNNLALPAPAETFITAVTATVQTGYFVYEYWLALFPCKCGDCYVTLAACHIYNYIPFSQATCPIPWVGYSCQVEIIFNSKLRACKFNLTELAFEWI